MIPVYNTFVLKIISFFGTNRSSTIQVTSTAHSLYNANNTVVSHWLFCMSMIRLHHNLALFNFCSRENCLLLIEIAHVHPCFRQLRLSPSYYVCCFNSLTVG